MELFFFSFKRSLAFQNQLNITRLNDEFQKNRIVTIWRKNKFPAFIFRIGKMRLDTSAVIIAALAHKYHLRLWNQS